MILLPVVIVILNNLLLAKFYYTIILYKISMILMFSGSVFWSKNQIKRLKIYYNEYKLVKFDNKIN